MCLPKVSLQIIRVRRALRKRRNAIDISMFAFLMATTRRMLHEIVDIVRNMTGSGTDDVTNSRKESNSPVPPSASIIQFVSRFHRIFSVCGNHVTQDVKSEAQLVKINGIGDHINSATPVSVQHKRATFVITRECPPGHN